MTIQSGLNPRSVFVVHGRNLAARNAVFEFLRSIDLRPLEWDDIARQTGSASPFVFEVLMRAFEVAQAVIVILTPDEQASLRPMLQTEPSDTRVRLQPRPNVLFEAGMAFMRDRDRTILVELGSTDMLSDLHGVHALRAKRESTTALRHQLMTRLQTAGCNVSVSGADWLSAGNFEAAFLDHDESCPSDDTKSSNTAAPVNVRSSAGSPVSAQHNTSASGSRSVAIGGDASGSIITGG